MSVFLVEEYDPEKDSDSTRQFMLAMRETRPLVSEFSAKLADQIIGYCLPRKRLLKAIKDSADNPNDLSAAMAALRREARGAFQQYRAEFPARSGEGGEMLAYAFTEYHLHAPMALAKMHTKTNSNMPVFGADGIHLRYVSEAGQLEVFYLESKVHDKLSTGVRDAAQSIRELLDGSQRNRELRLALDFGNFDDMDETAQQALEDFLDPYGAKTADRLDRHVCVIAYSEAAYQHASHGAEMEEIRGIFRSDFGHRMSRVETAYAEKELPADKITTFVVGLPSVKDFRHEFERALSNG